MKSERLFCLDALRGLDMLLLTVIGPLVMAFNAAVKLPDGFLQQLTHCNWVGITLWDCIMPLFIFVCGAAVPFGRKTWHHVTVRFVVLWLLGMIAQGNLLSLDPHRFVYFSNTLQAIAVGYVIAAVVFRVQKRALRIAILLSLALIYTLLLCFGGDYSPEGNFAMKVDMFFVNAFQACGHDTGTYTWYLTSLMFGVMTLCGMEATLVLKGNGGKVCKALILAAVGAALLAVGWALVPVIPPIKHIYTLSFTAQAMGWSFLALDALYVLADVLMLRRGWWLVTLFGQTALLAYMAMEVFGGTFYTFAAQVTQGVGPLLGERFVPLARVLTSSALLIVVLSVWRDARAFRKGKQ